VIGHIVWETDRVPAPWLVEMQPADELWVPTAWNRAAFEAAFDVPVHVVPHAASTTVPEVPPVPLRDGTFVVAAVSTWDWRKRPDRTIEAFLRAFGPGDDVALVVKTDRWPLAWPWRPDLPTVAHVADLVPAERRGQVHVATSLWSEGQILGLLERADCFLSLTSSEGWALGAFDAACLGTPVVITGFGGQVEWLGADHPGLLPYRKVAAVHPYATFEPGMEWAEPELDAAVDQLRDLAAGRAGALEKAAQALRRALPDRYSPQRVGRLASQALGAVDPSAHLAR
jgi:glycosyltransferase involved in cell wall biosynthesis